MTKQKWVIDNFIVNEQCTVCKLLCTFEIIRVLNKLKLDTVTLEQFKKYYLHKKLSTAINLWSGVVNH